MKNSKWKRILSTLLATMFLVIFTMTTFALSEAPTQAPTETPLATETPTIAPSHTPENTENPTEAPTEAPTDEVIDYTAPISDGSAFTTGFATAMVKQWLFSETGLSKKLVLIPKDAVVYVSKRNENILSVAIYTQRGLVEGYANASRLRPFSPEEVTSHLEKAEVKEDSYKYEQKVDKLLLPTTCEFPSKDSSAVVTEEQAKFEYGKPITIDGNGFSMQFVPTAPGEVVQEKTALSSKVIAGKTNPIMGEWVTFRVTGTGGTLPYQVKWDLYDSAGKYIQTSGYFPFSGSTTTMKLQVTGTVAVQSVYYRVSLRDNTGKVVVNTSPTVHYAKKMSFVKNAPNIARCEPGTKITFTSVPSGGEKPYQYQMNLYKGGYQLNTGLWKTGQQYVFIPAGTGDYRVQVNVKDARGRTLSGYTSYVVVQGKYRALVVGQSYANSNNVSPLNGTINDRNAVASMLGNMTYTSYGITKKANLTAGGIISSIKGVFKDAKDTDISLFYYSGHGVYSTNGTYLGALVGNDGNYVTPTQLRTALDTIKGTKIVIIDACHSGNMIGKSKNGNDDISETQLNKQITQSFISAFSSSGRSNLATGGYYVLVAAHSSQTSIEGSLSNGRIVGLFTYIMCYGAGYNEATMSRLSSLPADYNGDKRISLNELYNFVWNNTTSYTQATQVYPSNSAYVLFGR